MKFITTTEAGKKWDLSSRRIGVLCSEGRIPGVQKAGNTWLIPDDAEKPTDARIKSGKYIKNRNDDQTRTGSDKLEHWKTIE